MVICRDVPAVELNHDFAGAVVIHFLELSDVAFHTFGQQCCDRLNV